MTILSSEWGVASLNLGFLGFDGFHSLSESLITADLADDTVLSGSLITRLPAAGKDLTDYADPVT